VLGWQDLGVEMVKSEAEKLLDAALVQVPFDGWGSGVLSRAAADAGIDEAAARRLFPRGGVDLAVAFHARGDAAMLARMQGAEFARLRYSEKVGAAVRFRLQAIEDKEVARRSMTLFSLPGHAPEGTRLIWGTADAIWQALGDSSDDINWYSKRVILSGVYASCALFWLGDETPGHQASWEFVERRIGDVMRIEKLKARVRDNPGLSRVLSLADPFLRRIRAPGGAVRDDLPGHVAPVRDNS